MNADKTFTEMVLTAAASKEYSCGMLPRKIAITILYVSLIPLAALSAQQTASVGASTLQLLAPSHAPSSLARDNLKALPHIEISIHNSHTNADEKYAGVRLADLFTKLKMGVPLGSELRGKALAGYIVATGSDGYRAVVALAEIDPSFHPGEVIVADAVNGRALDAHSGPFKLVVTEDTRPARSVRNLVSLELKMAE